MPTQETQNKFGYHQQDLLMEEQIRCLLGGKVFSADKYYGRGLNWLINELPRMILNGTMKLTPLLQS